MILSEASVVIPTVGQPRAEKLRGALRSVADQTLVPGTVIVEEDKQHLGAPHTRQAGLERVQTELVLFLDDDDYWHENHVETCHRVMVETGADVVYPWMEGNDPFPQFFDRPWDSDNPHLFPICYLARTQVVRDAGGFNQVSIYGHSIVAGEDWPLILRMAGHEPNEAGEWSRVREGAKIVHVPERTWVYVAHYDPVNGRPGNYSGLPHNVPWPT